MKVALVTLHRVYNYGTALQAWSTQYVLEEAGHKVSVIDYITPHRTKRAIFYEPSANESQSGWNKIAYRFFKVFSIILKELTFGNFVRKSLHLTKKYVTAEDLDNDPPKADVYVTGSDQVWNSKYNHGVDRGFFLDFLPEDAHRVAFVASFGTTQLSSEAVSDTHLTCGSPGRRAHDVLCWSAAGLRRCGSFFQIFLWACAHLIARFMGTFSPLHPS